MERRAAALETADAAAAAAMISFESSVGATVGEDKMGLGDDYSDGGVAGKPQRGEDEYGGEGGDAAADTAALRRMAAGTSQALASAAREGAAALARADAARTWASDPALDAAAPRLAAAARAVAGWLRHAGSALGDATRRLGAVTADARLHRRVLFEECVFSNARTVSSKSLTFLNFPPFFYSPLLFLSTDCAPLGKACPPRSAYLLPSACVRPTLKPRVPQLPENSTRCARNSPQSSPTPLANATRSDPRSRRCRRRQVRLHLRLRARRLLARAQLPNSLTRLQRETPPRRERRARPRMRVRR